MTDFDSSEKQCVREDIWHPAFRDIIKTSIKEEEIKYLELPGPQCRYLDILRKDFPNIDLNNILLVEKEKKFKTNILVKTLGRTKLINKSVEDFFDNEEQVKEYFPFHIVNFDFCGQLFVFPSETNDGKNSAHQKRWDAISKTISNNTSLDVFYILLTATTARNNKRGYEFLERLWKDIQDDSIKAKLSYDDLIARIVPYVVCDEALNEDFNIINDELVSCRYRQKGNPYPMVTFKFKFVKIKLKLAEKMKTKKKIECEIRKQVNDPEFVSSITSEE